MITIKIAEIPIGIDNKYRFIEHLAADYLTDETAEFTVSATDEDIEREREISEGDFTAPYLETIVVYRKIADILPRYNAFVFHGAVLSIDGKGYVFTARSGVGKTTHTRLLTALLCERAFYVNGDKPIIRFIDGVPYAYGTPWRGKENYGRNAAVKLEGIVIVHRGEHNYTEEPSPDEAASMVVTQTYMPKSDGRMALKTLSLCNLLLGSVKLVDLYCNMEPDAPLATLSAFGIEIK